MGVRAETAMCVPNLVPRMLTHKIFKILLVYQLVILFKQAVI